MAAKTERVTILTTPDFKSFLNAEAKKEGVSVSELIRVRCTQEPANDDDEMVLKALIEQVNESSSKAKAALEQGLSDAQKALDQLRS